MAFSDPKEAHGSQGRLPLLSPSHPWFLRVTPLVSAPEGLSFARPRYKVPAATSLVHSTEDSSPGSQWLLPCTQVPESPGEPSREQTPHVRPEREHGVKVLTQAYGLLSTAGVSPE